MGEFIHDRFGSFVSDSLTDLKMVFHDLIDDDVYRIKGFDFSGMTCFDFGANVGVFTRLFKYFNPRGEVYCFEPVSRTMELLRMNTEGLEGINLFKYGIGVKSGVFDVFGTEDNSSVHSVVGKKAVYRERTSEKAELLGMDRIFSMFEPVFRNNSIFLKCDAEGGEEGLFFTDEGIKLLSMIKFGVFELHFMSEDMPSYLDYKEKINSIFGKSAEIYRRSRHTAYCTINLR